MYTHVIATEMTISSRNEQKDQQAILYERICDYARLGEPCFIDYFLLIEYDDRLPATRDFSVSAMCSLITIQDWLSSIRFAMVSFIWPTCSETVRLNLPPLGSL